MKIFISSTIEDMQEERNAVTEVINSLQMLVSRSEYFFARKESPKELCLKEAKECDVFIGLYKNRYGWIPQEDNPNKMSVSHMEYLEAKNNNRLMCLFIEQDSSKREQQLQFFVEKIRNFSSGHFVKRYKDVNELKYFISQSLQGLRNSLMLEDKERQSLANFSPDVDKFQQSILRRYQFDSIRGIAKKFNVISYQIENLFVPLHLSPYPTTNKIDEEYFPYFAIGIPPRNILWNDLSNFDSPKQKNDLITNGINILTKLSEINTLVILGYPGSGKSTLMKVLTNKLITNSANLPILIQIKDLSQYIKKNTNNSILDYLNSEFSDLQLSEDFFVRQLETGSCIIIFDGLDEVWDNEQRAIINSLIEKFSSMCGKDNKIIITSRFQGFEQNPISGNLEILQIDYFSSKQVFQFISNWFDLLKEAQGIENISKKNINELIETLYFSEGMESISRNPLLLLIVCLVYTNNLTIPKGKGELYKVFIETLLSVWEKSKGIKLEKYAQKDFEEIFKDIAFFMYQESSTRINQDTLFKIIKTTLNRIGLTKHKNQDIENLIYYFENRTGILVNDGLGNYNFYHLSFLEYFIALKLSTNKNIEDIFANIKGNIHNSINSEIISFIPTCIDDRVKTSHFLNNILETKTELDELLLLNLMLVLNGVVSGAILTDEFTAKIFQIIDKKLDMTRKYDSEFLSLLSELSNTSYKNDLRNLWRTKYKQDFWFLRTSITSKFLMEKDCYEDFLNFWKVFSKDRHHAISLAPILTQAQDTKQFEFIIKHLDEITDFGILDLLVFYFSEAVKNNVELQKLYLEKFNTSNEKLKFLLTKYTIRIDSTLAQKMFAKIKNELSSPELKSELEFLESSKNISKFQIFKNMLDSWLEHNLSEKEQDIHASWFIEQHPDSFNEDFLIEISSFLKKIPDNYTIIAFRMSDVFNKIIEFTDKFNELITSIIKSDDPKLKRWKRFFAPTEIKIFGASQEHKKTLIENVRNQQFYDVHRRRDFEELVANFNNDSEIDSIIEESLDDPELITNALHKMNSRTSLLIKNFSKLISMADKYSSHSHYAPILVQLRKAVKIKNL